MARRMDWCTVARGANLSASPARGYGLTVPEAVIPIDTDLGQLAIGVESSDSMLIRSGACAAETLDPSTFPLFLLHFEPIVCDRTVPIPSQHA